jgi:uncharacterized membrane protein
MFEIATIIAFLYLLTRVKRIEQYLRLKESDNVLVPVPEERKEIKHEGDPIPQTLEPERIEKIKSEVLATHTDNLTLESVFGKRYFTYIGAFAVLIGISFFLQYSFQAQLITPFALIILGLIVGGALCILGTYLYRTYSSYGGVLTGTGIVIIYICIYSAFGFFDLLTLFSTLFLVSCVTLLAVGLSVVLNSRALAFVAGLGGFLTPMLLNLALESSSLFFSYVTLLNIGFLILSYVKYWRRFAIGSFFATVLLYSLWVSSSFDFSEGMLAWIFISLFFFIYIAITFIHYGRHSEELQAPDQLLLWANPLMYFVFSYVIFDSLLLGYTSTLSLGLALLYAGLIWMINWASPWKPHRNVLQSVLAGISIMFFVLAVPLHFNLFSITILWSLQAVLLVWLGLRFNIKEVRVASMLLFGLATSKLVFIDAMTLNPLQPFFNTRFMTFVILGLSMIVAASLYDEFKALKDKSIELRQSKSILYISTLVLALLFSRWEIMDFFSLYWIAISSIVLATGAVFLSYIERDHILRVMGYAVFTWIIIRMVIFGHYIVGFDYGVFLSSRALVGALCAAALALVMYLLKGTPSRYLLPREKEQILPVLFIATHCVLLWMISSEIAQFVIFSQSGGTAFQNVQRVVVSLVWLIYASGLLTWGIVRNSTLVRSVSLVLFGITIVKVFIYDTIAVGDVARFISFITLGVILLSVGYLYNRYEEEFHTFIGARTINKPRV